MPPAWKDYQEEAAEFFRSLGLEASTDVKVDGARTSHDIDVLVRSKHLSFEVTWLVECKFWKTRVSKEKVLALRQIVIDVGADLGVLLCEVGFQSGAVEAANLTNVRLTSLAAMTNATKHDVFSMRLRELYDRVEVCRDRYWEIPKYKRIEYGLRPDVPEIGYSGDLVLNECSSILSQAFRGIYPVSCNINLRLIVPNLPSQLTSIEEVVTFLESTIEELEGKLDYCEVDGKGSSD